MNFFTNPVLSKELRRRIRGARAAVILTLYLTLTGIITLLIYLAITSSFGAGPTDLEAGPTIGRFIFLTVMTAALVQVCIITPSLTAGSVVGEKERESYDLLLTTLLSPLQIVLGKLAAALAFAMLLIMAVLPLAGLSFLFGGVSGTEMALGIVGLAVTAVLYATVGLFWSTVMRTTLGATVMAQGTVIITLLGIPFIFVIAGTMLGSPDDTNAYVYVFVLGTLLCLHPFIALGATAGLLSTGSNPFYFSWPISSNIEWILPMPWVAYAVMSLLLTLLFLFFSVRGIKPINNEVRAQKPTIASQKTA
ncbi:MAG: ABC transporter permease [Chloroflexaceae bacterium]|nr:ABC transporter permease [Chloroflexaceae bacterium]